MPVRPSTSDQTLATIFSREVNEEEDEVEACGTSRVDGTVRKVGDQLIRIRERRSPNGGTVDAAAAFAFRCNGNRHYTHLKKLTHRQLDNIVSRYDEEKLDVQTLMEDAERDDGPPDSGLPAPDKPGAFVMGRRNCLELVDPFSDALVLGDANLTFSLLLAEHRKSLCHVGRTVATTFEKLETLKERYTEIDDTIKKLEEMEAEVLHNVDCTRLAVDPRFKGMEGKFGAVYYNFPHAGVIQGFFDGHPYVRWRHANLMHLFFRSLISYTVPGGIVKVASNSRATGVRYSDIIEGARNSGFVHVETFPFLEWKLCKYGRSYGDRRDQNRRPEDGQVYNDQRAHSDMVYCFAYRPSGEEPAPVSVSMPPTKDEVFLAPNEGRLGRARDSDEQRKKNVDELYDLFLTYIQGIHVG